MSPPLTRHPNADDFRALARSSPWRFTTLHFNHGEVEAWLDRTQKRLIVRSSRDDGGTSVETVEGVPYSTSARFGWDTETGMAIELGPAEPTAELPLRRADGLVLKRPAGWHYDHGDPMWHDYRWTAMLDPAELADGLADVADEPPRIVPGVDLERVQELQVRGRRGWRAVCRPRTDAYEPRCGCCPLLDSVASRLKEYGPDDPTRIDPTLPTAYLVTLDVQTAIVIEIEALDGTGGTRVTNTIHAVDEPLASPYP